MDDRYLDLLKEHLDDKIDKMDHRMDAMCKRIDKSLDKTDKKVDSLLKFKWQAGGMLAVLTLLFNGLVNFFNPN